MINGDTIKSMICRTLADNFKNHTIYKNQVKQGTKLPCFFVSQLNSSNVKIARDRYKRNLIITIRFECENQNNSINDNMAFELMRLFQFTEYKGNKYVPKKIEDKNSDGVMQILLYYEIYIVDESISINKMNSTTLKINTKEAK